MLRRLLLPTLMFPFNALVVIPGVLLYVSGAAAREHMISSPHSFMFWGAIVMFVAGLTVALWTVALFARIGEGTPSPWDAPRRMVIAGPYRRVRNPMITGVFLMLLGETLLFASWAILGWCAVFAVANLLYIPLVEERRLARRFGDEYLRYRANVPRWLPRLTPWRP